jgi:FHS family L-fucose permease-like MFS transporter
LSGFALPKVKMTDHEASASPKDSVWKNPNLLFGAIAIFAYVGAEVSIGSFLVNYFALLEIAGFNARTAAGFV